MPRMLRVDGDTVGSDCSIAGNCKTTLMIALSPSPDSWDESVGTLKFAQRAKTLKTKVPANSTFDVEYDRPNPIPTLRVSACKPYIIKAVHEP